MEAGDGSQKALQIAFQTLKERCKRFQQHIAVLEAENVKLRGQVSQGDAESLSEGDTQKRRIRELTEQNTQLQSHLNMVSSENQQLWTELSKLTEVNKSLGTHLTKINESLSQHSAKKPVSRSHTYTIDDATKKTSTSVVDENEKVSLELEDISLKLINNIAKEKMELELQCSQMMEIQNGNFVGKANVERRQNEAVKEFKDTMVDEFLQNFKNMKYVLIEEKNKLTKALQTLGKLKREEKVLSHVGVQTVQQVVAQSTSPTLLANNESINRVHNLDRSTTSPTAQSRQIPAEPEDSLQPDITNTEKICPVCCLAFSDDITFMEFQHHVVEHFVAEDQPEYEVV